LSGKPGSQGLVTGVTVEKIPQLMLLAVQGSGYKQASVPDAGVDGYLQRPATHDGKHSRSESLFYYFRVENQVPENQRLRLSDRSSNLDFIRAKLKDSYCFVFPLRIGELIGGSARPLG